MASTSHDISISNTEDNKRASAQSLKKHSPNKSNIASANKFLKYSGVIWFLAILTGQWFFFYYIMAFYVFSVINNNLEIWNLWEALGSSPYKEGDTTGNWMFAAHAIGAGIVAFGGALQL